MTPATIPTLTLNNGVTMPALGLGVFRVRPSRPPQPLKQRSMTATD